MSSIISAWINASINNCEAGDLRCHCAHYDVIVLHSLHMINGSLPFLMKHAIYPCRLRVINNRNANVFKSFLAKNSLDKRLRSHNDVIKLKHFPRNWSFVPVNSPHKGQWRGFLLFSLMCAWINGWINNREAGDLRRHRAHYDATVMVTV